MKPLVRFRFNCDRLWKLWYSLVVIFLHIILIGFAISNYIHLKSQSIDSRFGGKWFKTPLNMQLLAIILSFALFILLVYSCIFKVGNIANDGVELGSDHNSINNAFKTISSNKRVGIVVQRLKSHLLPYNCLLHVVIALLLALPAPLMQAEQIRNEAVSPEFLWTIDVHYIMNPQFTNVQNKPVILCNKIKCVYPSKPPAVSPEFLNLILSLLILTVRISSPFWFTNKAFAIIFSFFAFVTSFAILSEYELLVLFVKIVHNEGTEFFNVSVTTRISVLVTLMLSFVKSLLMIFMLIVIFEYGYSQYMESMRNYRHYFMSDVDSVSQQSHNKQQIKWFQLMPRLLGVFVLVIVAVIKINLLYTFMEFYFKLKELPTIVLFNLGISSFYFIASVFLWFGLCIKSKWQFHINIQGNPISNISPGKLAGSPEPVYGCFYNATSGSSQTSLSKPILRSSIDGSEVNSFRLPSGNYVMMQTGSNAIPSLEYTYGGSEVSYGSQNKSIDSNEQRYRPYMFHTPTIEGSQYSTLASLQQDFMLTTKALSDTSSNDTVTIDRSRRPSNRVTFKEQLNIVNNARFQPEFRDFQNNSIPSSTSDVPDILSTNKKFVDGPPSMYSEMNTHHGFDTDLEMSTDMRHGDTCDRNARDPKLCSQV